MSYQVHSIEIGGDISRCPVFHVDNFMWTCVRRPETFGRMAYLRGRGLLVRMTCLEAWPKRALKNHRDMVCNDSAMEAFFSFEARPRADSLYLNFEVNANGAMYAQYGHGRGDRAFLTDEEYAMTGVTAALGPDSWTVELLVPLTLLGRVAGVRELHPGERFFCNFYKISEDPAIEHYAAYSRVMSETPDFHLPQFFAEAVVAD